MHWAALVCMDGPVFDLVKYGPNPAYVRPSQSTIAFAQNVVHRETLILTRSDLNSAFKHTYMGDCHVRLDTENAL